VPKEKTQDNNNVIYYIIGASLFAVLVVVLIFCLAFYRRRKQAHFNEIPTVISSFLASLQKNSKFKFIIYIFT